MLNFHAVSVTTVGLFGVLPATLSLASAGALWKARYQERFELRGWTMTVAAGFFPLQQTEPGRCLEGREEKDPGAREEGLQSSGNIMKHLDTQSSIVSSSFLHGFYAVFHLSSTCFNMFLVSTGAF